VLLFFLETGRKKAKYGEIYPINSIKWGDGMNWWQKNRWTLLIMLSLAAFWLGWWLIPRIQQPVIISEIEITGRKETASPAGASPGEDGADLQTEGDNISPEKSPLPEIMVVHVGGAVVRPGVYQLAADSRAVDGILAAGGSTETAALDFVNLARPLRDGEQLIIPEAGDNPEVAGIVSRNPSSPVSSAPEYTKSGLINLNRAGVAELTTLPGIGEVRARAIIAYREESGPFKSPEDLIAVPGIGPAILVGLIAEVEAP